MAVVATLSKGYDLDYIWKQVDRGPAKDAASYYIQASESGGEPPGRWRGPGPKRWASTMASGSSESRTTCCSASVKVPTAPRSEGLLATAAKPPTFTRSCWPPNRTLRPNAAANCGSRPLGRPARARCSST